VDMGSVDGRARLAELARPLITRVPRGVYRELLTSQVAEAVGISAAKLDAIVSRDGLKAKAGHRVSGLSAARQRGAHSPTGSRPSAVRRAITLVLHNPEAAAKVDPASLNGIDRPGAGLLRELIETAQSGPNMSMAGLLERFRNHEQARALGKLAAVEMPPAEEFDPAAELADCLAQLITAGTRDRVQILIEKESLSALSEEELNELRRLARRPAVAGKAAN
jgi:DNA primase